VSLIRTGLVLHEEVGGVLPELLCDFSLIRSYPSLPLLLNLLRYLIPCQLTINSTDVLCKNYITPSTLVKLIASK